MRIRGPFVAVWLDFALMKEALGRRVLRHRSATGVLRFQVAQMSQKMAHLSHLEPKASGGGQSQLYLANQFNTKLYTVTSADS
jgi:hypothetical protein